MLHVDGLVITTQSLLVCYMTDLQNVSSSCGEEAHTSPGLKLLLASVKVEFCQQHTFCCFL